MAGLFFRLLFKALVPVMMILGGLAYFSYLQGQDPLAALLKPFGGAPDISLQALQRKAESLGEQAETSIQAPRTVYRWRDAAGHRYYGEYPPADALEVVALNIDPDVNVISAFRDPAQLEAESVEEPAEALEAAPAEGLPNPYSPEQIKKLFEEAQQLRDKLEAQHQAREDLFRQLD